MCMHRNFILSDNLHHFFTQSMSHVAGSTVNINVSFPALFIESCLVLSTKCFRASQNICKNYI